MSTRATYLFKTADSWSPNICLYIHHDGYCEGAAYYLYNAFMVDRTMTVESMIRGNHRAEITREHDAHGDTEYRYTIENNTITVQKGYGDDWATTYRGDWVDFINKHISPEWRDGDVETIKRVNIGYVKNAPYTPSMLKKELDKELALLGQWSVGAYKDSPDAANMRGLKDRIAAIQSLLSGYGTPQWRAAA